MQKVIVTQRSREYFASLFIVTYKIVLNFYMEKARGTQVETNHPARFLKKGKFREKIEISWLASREKDLQCFQVSIQCRANVFRYKSFTFRHYFHWMFIKFQNYIMEKRNKFNSSLFRLVVTSETKVRNIHEVCSCWINTTITNWTPSHQKWHCQVVVGS